MSDYRRRLGLPHSPTLHEVRRAYRDLARRSRAQRGEPGRGNRLDTWHVAYAVDGPDGAAAAAPPGAPEAAWRGDAQACDDAFRDEVDVDFPSMAKLVGRMRRSFFGEAAPRLLSADVRLTPSQADRGVSVPFDVSLRHTCPACGGRGEVWPDPCGACHGSGAGLLPHQLQLVVPPGVRDGTCLRFDVTPPYAPAARVRMRISVP
jgi:hypothetical protein